MVTELSYFKKIKEIIEINDGKDFEITMNAMYKDLYSSIDAIKRTDDYNKDIKDKFTNSIIPLKDKDMDKLIEFFQNNPIDLYNIVLDTINHIKTMSINKDIELSTMGIIYYNKLKSECKNNIQTIVDDFNSKYENGYFDKEEK